MDDPLPELSEAVRARLWAAFNRLDDKRQTKRIGLNKCKRKAYTACVREELSHEAALAIVVRWGRRLKWLATHYPKSGYGGGFRRAGITLPPVPPPQPIPEVDQRAEIAAIVADLTVPTSPQELFKLAQARHTMDEITHRLRVARSTLYRWQRDPYSVRPATAEAITAGLRKLVSE